MKKRRPSLPPDLQDILFLWEALHAGWERSIRSLPKAAFAFRPKPRMRTLGDLIRHTLVAELFYFYNLLEKKKCLWKLPKEISTSREALALIRRVHKHSLNCVNRLRESDLNREIRFPIGPKITVRYLLMHAMVHEAHHRAQIYTYIHLWESPGKRYSRPWKVVRGYPGLAWE